MGILAGRVLLCFPFREQGGPYDFSNPFITAPSAVRVTGLDVVDTGKDLSWIGRVIALGLIQIGGLGIMTISTVFFVLMGRGIPFKEREIVQSSFMHTPGREFAVIAKYILRVTFATEPFGALVLWFRFAWDFPAQKACSLAVFHAASAFHLAGFFLFSDSLVRYQTDGIVNLTVMMLIVHGGIGFIVQYELPARWEGRRRRLSLQTKLALATPAVLITGGATLFHLFERNHPLKSLCLERGFSSCCFNL